MRMLLTLGLVVVGMIAIYALVNRSNQPTAETAVLVIREPGEDWSGLWGEAKSQALLRLRHGVNGSLAGDYVPHGDRAVICRFSGGSVQGELGRFDLKMNGKLWHCTLERSGNTLTLRGRRDVDALFKEYGDDHRLPNGIVMITPRSTAQRAQDAQRLARKREEIKKAANPVILGIFERIEVRQ
jgi:hypothetical protein